MSWFLRVEMLMFSPKPFSRSLLATCHLGFESIVEKDQVSIITVPVTLPSCLYPKPNLWMGNTLIKSYLLALSLVEG